MAQLESYAAGATVTEIPNEATGTRGQRTEKRPRWWWSAAFPLGLHRVEGLDGRTAPQPGARTSRGWFHGRNWPVTP